MTLEIEGRIARKLNVQTGTSSRGAWSKQEFVIEYQEGNLPTQLCMNVWGEDKVKELTGVGSRCIPIDQEEISNTCVCCGRAAKKLVYWGKAY